MADVEGQAVSTDAKIVATVAQRRKPPPPPPREKMAHCLAKMESKRYSSWRERLTTEMTVVGTHMFDAASPRTYGMHYGIFSGLVCILIASAYCYMAGAYLTQEDGDGPSSLRAYFVDNRSFSTDFLRRWGADYGPATRNQAFRIVTYAWLHQNLLHFLGNLLIFGLVSFSLEHR